MALSAGIKAVALKIQEAVTAKLANSDVCRWLSDAVSELADGGYGYYLDHIGDGTAGVVIYCCNGDIQQAPYTISQAGGKASATIKADKAVDVLPMTSYVKQGAASEAAIPAPAEPHADFRFVESATFASEINLRESTSALNPLVKIISPGRGSSGYYTEAVLKRDGPQIFPRGTLMYINHATDAEEAARPEGDYSKLAAVTTDQAFWDSNGKDGPALYAHSKVFSGVSAEVAEKAPFTGVSIRARGQYAESATGLPKAGLKAAESKIAPDGKPGLIGKLTGADSIDLVTKAGRDGKLLLESAVETPAVENPTEGAESDMDEATAKKLLESNRKLSQRLALREARDMAGVELGSVRLPDATKTRLIERVVGMAPINAEGELDSAAFKTLIEAEVKDEAAYLSSLTGGRIVTGNGSAEGAAPTEADVKTQEAQRKLENRRLAASLGFSGPEHKVGRRILEGGRAAFDPNYNSAQNGVGVTAED